MKSGFVARLALMAGMTAALAAAQAKVGVVNVQQALLSTAEIKKAQADLQAKYAPQTKELDALQQEIQQLQTQLQSGQGKLSDAAQQDLVARGQQRQRQFQRKSEDLQGDVDRERNDILQRSGQRMTEVVRQLAAQRDLDMVVDTANTIYTKPALDLTKDAVAAYDKAYPAK